MSFSIKSNPRRRSYVRLVGEIQRALNGALQEENQARGLTRKMIADLLGKNKSVITRKFAGSSNMTLETLADLAYALDRPVKVSLPSRHSPASSNYSHSPAAAQGTPAPAARPPVNVAVDGKTTVSVSAE
jgi:ribosome-binding protein aMBF1 (putative translation factor)